MKIGGLSLRSTIIIAIIFALLIVLGTFATINVFEGENQYNLLKEGGDKISAQIDTLFFQQIPKLSSSLSKNEHVKAVLLGKTDPDNLEVYTVLETIQETNEADIAYVMDKDGLTVSSSRYGEDNNKTLTGKSYEFRPYFQEAIKGNEYVYAAVGVTTDKRGAYFSSPVLEENKVIGVVVIKMGLEKVDALLGSTNYSACIVSPDKVIFGSNEENLFQIIEPLSEKRLREINDSRQFASRELVSTNWLFNENKVEIGGVMHYFYKASLDILGWEIILHDKVTKDVGLSFYQKIMIVVALLIITILTTAIIFLGILNNKKNIVEEELGKYSKTLKSQVGEKTKELKLKLNELKKTQKRAESKNEELKRFNKLMVGRELKMKELKTKIKKLKGKE